MRVEHPLNKLYHPATYATQIEKLRKKQRQAHRQDDNSQQRAALSAISIHRRSFSRVLTRTIQRGEYVFSPMEERIVRIGDKDRSLYRSSISDKIVLAALAEITVELIAPYLSPSVYSYQKGKSSLTALNHFASYLAHHKSSRPEPKDRGLYIIKRDISAYGESIPVTDDSPLWEILQDALVNRGGVPNADPFLSLLKSAIRPQVVKVSGKVTELDVGVPTGSSIQPAICNLYLTPLDRTLDTIPGSFFARYGDDFLFAHPEAAVARKAAFRIDEIAQKLRLEIKDEKKQNCYFTNPGRPSVDWPETTNSSFIEYLGCRISFSGIIGLKTEKAHRLLRDLRTRMRTMRNLLDGSSVDTLAPVLCAVVNAAMDPHESLCHPTSSLLRYIVNDRAQLKHLDYLIALSLAETLSGKQGVRAFRTIPYKKLRRTWNLHSLVVARNTIEKKQRKRGR
jgi:hypothetical protein